MAKKTWAERWGESEVDYSNKETVEKTLRKIRNLTARRVASLRGSDSFSFAEDQLTKQMKKLYMFGKLPDLEQLGWQTKEQELRLYHQFWASKTATKAGSRNEQIRQSIRLFGTDSRGKPLRLLTIEEGRAYWDVYDKYYELHGEESTHLDSNRVQRILGESINTILNPDMDLVHYLNLVKFDLEHEHDRGVPFSDEELASRAVARDILMSPRSIIYEEGDY